MADGAGRTPYGGKWGVTELANRINVSPRAVSDWKRGGGISAEHLEALVKVFLGRSPDQEKVLELTRAANTKATKNIVSYGATNERGLPSNPLPAIITMASGGEESVVFGSSDTWIPLKDVFITVNLDQGLVTESELRNLIYHFPQWKPNKKTWRGDIPGAVSQAFKTKNTARLRDASRGIKQETADTSLIRLVSMPNFTTSSISMVVAPLSWELFSSTLKYPPNNHPGLQGKYEPTPKLLAEIKDFTFDDSTSDAIEQVGLSNIVPLGLEALVITSDNKILLRERDITSATGSGEWDVSFSGYARFGRRYFNANSRPEQLPYVDISLAQWAAHEFEREIGIAPGSLESSYCVGLHRNVKSGAMDVMVVCKINLHSETLAESLYIKTQLDKEEHIATRRGGLWNNVVRIQRRLELIEKFRKEPFLRNSHGAIEEEVHNTANWFVEFEVSKIEQVVNEVIYSTGGTLMPEGKKVLLYAIFHHFGDVEVKI
jgi:transcriptional regulator with XRE-family HTH domain